MGTGGGRKISVGKCREKLETRKTKSLNAPKKAMKGGKCVYFLFFLKTRDLPRRRKKAKEKKKTISSGVPRFWSANGRQRRDYKYILYSLFFLSHVKKIISG